MVFTVVHLYFSIFPSLCLVLHHLCILYNGKSTNQHITRTFVILHVVIVSLRPKISLGASLSPEDHITDLRNGGKRGLTGRIINMHKSPERTSQLAEEKTSSDYVHVRCKRVLYASQTHIN